MSQDRLSQDKFRLTATDKDLFKTLRTLCKSDGHMQFSSDTFRMYQLDRFLLLPKHQIGSFFAKLVNHKLIRAVGWIRSTIASNNQRKINLYEFTGKEIT